MTSSCGSLDVGETVLQSWEVALAIVIAATSISTAIALNENSVTTSCGSLEGGQTVFRSWKVALLISLAATSISTARG